MKSQEIYKAACAVFPGGVNSPIRAFKGREMSPLIAEEGKGAYLYDADGNKYLDFCTSFGALILGHSPPRVVKKIQEQAEKGLTFGLTTALEEKLAKKILSALPFLEKLRFVSSGTEAVMTAVRLARACTGRSKIIKFSGNYHGHSDGFLFKAGSFLFSQPLAGVPESIVRETVSLPYNDILSLKQHLSSEIAAVILEPMAGNMGFIPASQEFILFLREETKKLGILLIADEVITGFRLKEKTACTFYQIEPDLICLGKVIGGGLPAAAFGGKKELMDRLAPLGDVFQAGTLSGNPLAMQAGYETLTILEELNVLSVLEEKQEFFLAPIEEFLLKNHLPHSLNRKGSLFSFFFKCPQVKSYEDLEQLDGDYFNRFFKYLLKNGVYFPPSPYETAFISYAFTDQELTYTRDLIIDFIKNN